MLKVLFITASKDRSGRTNVGDRVILAGVRNLIAGAFGAYAYREIGRWGRYPDAADDYDLIVYAGMPQYGGRNGPTEVEQRFQDYMDSAKKARFINIGGGTPTGIDFDAEGSSSNMAKAGIGQFYQRQTGLALRTTRDLVGKRFFDKIGSECDLRPCPSFFSTLHMAPAEKMRDAIAFLSDDTFVTNRVRGNMSDHLKALIERLPGYELVAHSKGDLVQLGRLGGEHVYFRSELDAIDYYSTVRNLASLRIHAGVPSWTQGANVVVGAFDGRAQMFADVGMPLPVIDLVNNDFSALATKLLDPATHTPYEQRQQLILTAFKAFVERLRGACPELAGKAGMQVEAVEGFSVYPLNGRVEKAADFDGYFPEKLARPPHFVDESDEGNDGCVLIPAGAIAANGVDEEVILPQTYAGSQFTSANGAITGTTCEVPLGIKTGALARGPKIRVPFGKYTVEVRVAIESEQEAEVKSAFQLVVMAKTAHAAYAENPIAFSALKGGRQEMTLSLSFENAFPSAALLLDVILRGTKVPAKLNILELKIDTAV